MKNYVDILQDNADDFEDIELLEDFINNYTNEKTDNIRDLEDYISEYADSIIPIYYADIVKEWEDNGDAQGLADEQGLLGDEKNPYKIMQADLFCFFDNQLRVDYQKFLELLKKTAMKILTTYKERKKNFSRRLR